MPINLSCEVKGPETAARTFLDALASPMATPETDEQCKVSWSPPSVVPGISSTTYEILGTIGIFSLPISVAASILANVLTQRMLAAYETIKPATADAKRSPIKVTLTFFDLKRERIVKLDLDDFDNLDRNLIRDVFLRISDDN